jgi:hypothetical protein
MISNDYKLILESLNGKENFGKRKSLPKHLDIIVNKLHPKSILDFGCGKGSLVSTLQKQYPDKTIFGYDPGNNQFKNLIHGKVDLLISTDVLEHVEPEFLDATLLTLKDKSKFFYHLIALSPSKVILPDGRNAHLIIQSKDWWITKFVQLGYKLNYQRHMFQIKKDKTVNKLIISGSTGASY